MAGVKKTFDEWLVTKELAAIAAKNRTVDFIGPLS